MTTHRIHGWNCKVIRGVATVKHVATGGSTAFKASWPGLEKALAGLFYKYGIAHAGRPPLNPWDWIAQLMPRFTEQLANSFVNTDGQKFPWTVPVSQKFMKKVDEILVWRAREALLQSVENEHVYRAVFSYIYEEV